MSDTNILSIELCGILRCKRPTLEPQSFAICGVRKYSVNCYDFGFRD